MQLDRRMLPLSFAYRTKSISTIPSLLGTRSVAIRTDAKRLPIRVVRNATEGWYAEPSNWDHR